MGRLATAAALLALPLLPATALAQGGNGLYEPFPKAAVEKRAKRFVQRLDSPVRFSERDLDEGTFVDPGAIGIERGLAPAATLGGASERAGTAGDGSSVPVVLQLLLVALCAISLPLIAGRRPTRRAVHG